MTTSERAVRKASRERLLRDFALAAKITQAVWSAGRWSREDALAYASRSTSRTRYACLMTAFGL